MTSEILRALGVLCEPPSAETARLTELLELGQPPTAEEHSELFLLQLHPYASVYLGTEGMMGGEARDRIAGFWRTLHLTPPAEPDHLALMLGLHARLTELEAETSERRARDAWRGVRKAWLWEHLASWLPAWLSKLDEIGTPFYKRWGELLTRALLEETESLGPPARLPLHLREAPPVADPRSEGAPAFLSSLLAPVSSGAILTRGDLIGGAAEMGLATRRGERRFVVENLLDQDAMATLAWLRRQATAWVERHRAADRSLAAISGFWAKRAGATAGLLGKLAREAQ